MAHVRTEPAGEPVPVRTMDEVGLLDERVQRARRPLRRSRARVPRRPRARERGGPRSRGVPRGGEPRAAQPAQRDPRLRRHPAHRGRRPALARRAREEVEQIRGSGQHLLELINDILEFSALESGQLRLSRGRSISRARRRDVVREAAGVLTDKPVAHLACRRRAGRPRARRLAAPAAGRHEPRRQRDQVHPARRGRRPRARASARTRS